MQVPGEQNDLFTCFSSMPVITVNYKAPTMTRQRQVDLFLLIAELGGGEGHPDFTPGNGPARGGC